MNVMDQSNTRLTEVEQQLLELVTVDNQSWAKIYILMEEVEKNKLYEPEFSSFTKWLIRLLSMLKSKCLSSGAGKRQEGITQHTKPVSTIKARMLRRFNHFPFRRITSSLSKRLQAVI